MKKNLQKHMMQFVKKEIPHTHTHTHTHIHKDLVVRTESEYCFKSECLVLRTF